ncbi:MAG: ATP-dependent zinc metalloprotease FtsH [Sphaerochaetaceae bacterium]|nr:ATP-dependent zinc metalloprotease FtsH [Sphaerochaetaceae bacterium]
MEEKKPNGKPMFYYVSLVFIILLILNSFVFPLFLQNQVVDTSYTQFINDVDSGKVKAVSISDSTLVYTEDDSNGNTLYFRTGMWPDDTTLLEKLQAKGVDITAQISEEKMSPIASFLVSWVIPILIFSILGKFIFNKMGGASANALSFGKSNAKVYVEAQTGKTFADVAGEDEAKDSLMEVVDFLHNPQKYEKIGAKLPKGVLLVGPPGTGKTLLAKAVAGEAKVPFFSISGSEFVEMFVGMGAAKVRDLFKQAQEKAPCIVFIDEIDTIGKKREDGFGSNDEREQTLNQLLTEMDGFDSTKGVVILAATNRPEMLDKALLRPGRFDRRVPVELPDLNGREAILKVHAKDVKMDPKCDLHKIALATAGASGADLANMINEAALSAVRGGREEVEQQDLEDSVEVVIAGYKRKNAIIPPDEKKIVAYHEIGHAIVAARQTNSAPVQKITIVPRTSGALGYTMQVPEEEQNLMSKQEILNKIATFTGGRAAEEVVFGQEKSTSGASNDIEQATKMARTMVMRLGMSDEFGMTALETESNPYLGGDMSLSCSADTAAKVDAKVVEIIKAQHQKAIGILKDNRAELDAAAKLLLEKETISGEELMAILSQKALAAK